MDLITVIVDKLLHQLRPHRIVPAESNNFGDERSLVQRQIDDEEVGYILHDEDNCEHGEGYP